VVRSLRWEIGLTCQCSGFICKGKANDIFGPVYGWLVSKKRSIL
jgi:hypothetical protein